MNIQCRKCKEVKDISQYSKHPSPMGVRKVCKSCLNAYSKIYLSNKRESIHGVLRGVLAGCRHRSKARGLEFDIDLEYLISLWKSQKGLCALSGIPMDYGISGNINPEAEQPSLDRIIPSMGYTKGNIQFILYALNMGKGSWDIGHILSLWATVLEFQCIKDDPQTKEPGSKSAEGEWYEFIPSPENPTREGDEQLCPYSPGSLGKTWRPVTTIGLDTWVIRGTRYRRFHPATKEDVERPDTIDAHGYTLKDEN